MESFKKKSNMLEYIFQDQLEIVNQSKLWVDVKSY